MLKEFAEWFVKKIEPACYDLDGQKYSSQPLHVIPEPTADPLVVHNLTGLVDYLKSNYDDLNPVIVHVASPTEVNVYSTFNGNKNRDHFLQAKAMLPSIPFGRFLDPEEFIILLQSCFVANDDRAQLLKVVGNIKEENVTTVGDDGVTQQVTAKTGVATVENVIVPNPVRLKPYRTFVEIVQPESEFVFRMRSGPAAALFEADGGAWKLQAIHAISDYLIEQLSEEISVGQVTIIA